MTQTVVSKIKKAEQSLSKTVNTLVADIDKELATKISELEVLEDKISDKQNVLKNIETEVSQKRKNAQIDFKISLKEDKQNAFIEAFGTTHKLLTNSEYEVLLESIEKLKREKLDAVEFERSESKREYQIKEQEIKLEANKENAQLKQDNAVKEATIKSLNEQLVELKEQITANRNASVEMAKARTQNVYQKD